VSERHAVFLRQGLIGTCAFVALVLLAAFYSTVSGAVERAARQRTATAEGVPRAANLAVARPAPRARALLARVDD
jgi:hypothetical protein